MGLEGVVYGEIEGCGGLRVIWGYWGLLGANMGRNMEEYCCPAANNSLNEILESQTLEDELGKSRGSPQKGKSRLIT